MRLVTKLTRSNNHRQGAPQNSKTYKYNTSNSKWRKYDLYTRYNTPPNNVVFNLCSEGAGRSKWTWWKKNHLVPLVIANALKPTHTLTILEPISDFDGPENVCLSPIQVLVLLVLLSCFHTHSTFVLDFVCPCNYLVTTILDFAGHCNRVVRVGQRWFFYGTAPLCMPVWWTILFYNIFLRNVSSEHDVKYNCVLEISESRSTLVAKTCVK